MARIIKNHWHQRSNFKQPDTSEFEQLKQLVEKLWLDNENLNPEQFSVLTRKGKIIAFGRLRESELSTELCTLGVVEEFRGTGLGKKMVEHLLSRSKTDVYIVTVIPAFFTEIGFILTEEYPQSIKQKVGICNKHYHVGEPYRVMKWKKK